MSSPVGKKKFIVIALLTAGLVAASLAAATSFASAQNATNLLGNKSNNNDTQGQAPFVNNTNTNITQTATSSKIVGSINVKQAARDLLNEKVKLTLAEASSKAESQVNGKAITGRLCVVQGYLVYTITLANTNNETLQKVIVDAGNGSVLSTLPARDASNSALEMIDNSFGNSMHHHHHHHHYEQ